MDYFPKAGKKKRDSIHVACWRGEKRGRKDEKSEAGQRTYLRRGL